MLQDLRYAIRLLRRSPGFAAAAILTLAIGIGANSAIYSVLQAVWIDAVPFRDPGRLVFVYSAGEFSNRLQVSLPDFEDWRRENTVFEDLVAYQPTVARVRKGDTLTLVAAMESTPALFKTLGTQPVLGRALADDDGRPNAAPVAVISHGYWTRQFAGDPSVIGRTLPLEARTVTIVGVASPDSKLTAFEPSLWMPLAADPGSRGNGAVSVIGRLRRGVSIRAAEEQMTAIAGRLAAAYPDTNRRRVRATVVALRDQIVGLGIADSLFLLFGATSAVLLIAMTNIANLLVARGAERVREMAVRTALGAGRREVVRMIIAESAIVTGTGAALGLALCLISRRALVASMPSALPRADAIAIDARVLAFTVAVSVVTALVMALAPAWRALACAPSAVLAGTAPAASPARRRLSAMLVAAEVGLAVIVLACAGLLVRSFERLAATSPGFDPRYVVTLRIRDAGGQSPASTARAVLEALSGIPGVAAAGAIDTLPLAGGRSGFGYTLPGRPASAGQQSIDGRRITPGYLAAMRIPIVDGRDFAADADHGPATVVVNQTAARQLWPGTRAVGQQITVGAIGTASVVGVAGDVRHDGLGEPARPEVYLPYLRRPSGVLTYVVRTRDGATVDLSLLTSHIERAGWRVADVRTLDEVVMRSINVPRFRAWLFGLMGLLVVALAAIGVFGVTAYAVAARRREVGIRIALGARPAQILGLVVGDAAVPIGAGVMAGVGAAVMTNRLVAHFLYAITPADPTTLALVAFAVVVTALAAAIVPARRTLDVDPVTVLKV